MKCPIDGIDLVMADRQGVEIDYCPTCRGVWLDRGELDKIIERSTANQTSARTDYPENAHSRAGHGGHGKGDDSRGRGHDDDERGRDGRKRNRGLLGDIFDF
ncbi:zf-TFIIB domain-containing protein [Devosia sp.]|uniref:TFIIB-type zinc ribbon-containing protein n=1 Tax=Devosia sp. TaxID=1871048 RepID=UPI003F71C937